MTFWCVQGRGAVRALGSLAGQPFDFGDLGDTFNQDKRCPPAPRSPPRPLLLLTADKATGAADAAAVVACRLPPAAWLLAAGLPPYLRAGRLSTEFVLA